MLFLLNLADPLTLNFVFRLFILFLLCLETCDTSPSGILQFKHIDVDVDAS